MRIHSDPDSNNSDLFVNVSQMGLKEIMKGKSNFAYKPLYLLSTLIGPLLPLAIFAITILH